MFSQYCYLLLSTDLLWQRLPHLFSCVASCPKKRIDFDVITVTQHFCLTSLLSERNMLIKLPKDAKLDGFEFTSGGEKMK